MYPKRRTFLVPARQVERSIPHTEEAFLSVDDPDTIIPAIEFNLPSGEVAYVYGELTNGQTHVLLIKSLIGASYKVVIVHTKPTPIAAA